MPLALSTKVLLALGTVGTAVYALNRREAKKRKRKKKPAAAPQAAKSRDPGCLFKVHSEGAKVGDSERILNDLHESLQTDEVRNTPIAIDPAQAEVVYDYMIHMVADQNMDLLGSPSVRDEAITRSLKLIASGCDWREGLGPYTYGSPFQEVWSGVGTLGELVQTDLEMKGAEG